MKKTCCIFVTLITLGIPSSFGSLWAQQATLGKPFIAVRTSDNAIFDSQLVHFLAPRVGLVGLNIPARSKLPGFSLGDLVASFHQTAPNTPVLLYSWATQWTRADSNLASIMLEGFPTTSPAVLRVVRSRSSYQGPKDRNTYYANPGQPLFQDWITRRLKNYVDSIRADGLLIDLYFRTPPFLVRACRREAVDCTSYHEGVDQLLEKISARIAPKLVVYNGLWNDWPTELNDQAKLLSYADGAWIEFFGRNPKRPIPPFAQGIQPYLKAIRSQPTKTFLVSGRGEWGAQDYKDDYSWQRYLYCAYLMIAGPNTHFHYQSTFGVPSVGRADALSWYADWDLPLGDPKGGLEVRNRVYLRAFSDGLVLLNPRGGELTQFPLPAGTWYTPEGRSQEGSIAVPPGKGILLLKKRPTRRNVDLQMGDDTTLTSDWPRTTMHTEPVFNYVRVAALDPGLTPQHDLLLDPIRSLDPPTTLTMRYRTNDSTASVLFVAETDGSDAIVVFGSKAVEGSASGASRTPLFRSKHSGKPGTLVPAPTFLQPDGEWHVLTLDGRLPLGPGASPTIQVRRWIFARFSGSMDVSSVGIR